MSEQYKATGRLTAIGEIQTFPSGFQKRECVIESTEGQYSNLLAFELVKERVSLSDSWSVGDELTVFFNIRSNEHNGRYFTNVTAWKVDQMQQQSQPANQQPQANSNYNAPATNSYGQQMQTAQNSQNRDIPF